MRLDIFLFQNSLAKSREFAKSLITTNKVMVNGKMITKPAFDIIGTEKIEILKSDNPYVSRGGLKLLKALDIFKIDVADNICVDIGASTGGFTDCLLKKNAKLVYAIDVGTSQLDDSLLSDKRVVNLEKTNIKSIKKEDFKTVDFICCDVSFISLSKVIPIISDLLDVGKKAVMLIKPQFEMEKQHKLKKGVVKDIESHKKILYNIIDVAVDNKLSPKALDYSPIKGGKGNIEYIFYCEKNGASNNIDALSIIKNARNNLKELEK
ncbi:MAG: TlyA family RNA methyltransferase [Clostridia bacterium]